jgi:hypothetical protein
VARPYEFWVTYGRGLFLGATPGQPVFRQARLMGVRVWR